MFGIDFYPTPPEVIEKMLAGALLTDKVILEPSAGSGNIVGYCTEMLAKEVLACEIDERLRKILSGKCHIIENDFLDLTAERISHIDYIVMNPPFSKQEQHILHAWDIAPEGCQIISLCNYSMLDNRHTRQRSDIGRIIEGFGRSDYFGKCFDTSERKTDVSIGCVWLYKPKTGNNEFEGYFDLYDYEQDEINGSGIVKYDFVQDIVSRYVEAVSLFNEVEETNKRMTSVIGGVTDNFSIKFGATYTRGDNKYLTITRQVFKKELQKAAWNKIFGMMNMEKYVTRGVMSDINKFVEQQIHVPFTVKNVYLMIQMIAGTHAQRMDQVIVEAFEKICNYSYENSTAGEGWRTNTDFLINKKFILPWMTEIGWHGELKLKYNKDHEMDDIAKALCHLTATNYDSIKPFYWWVSDFNNKAGELNRLQFGQWYEWGFFRFKGFKKGTMHFEFVDEDLWARFNQKVAEIKGWTNMVTHTKKGRKAKGK